MVPGYPFLDAGIPTSRVLEYATATNRMALYGTAASNMPNKISNSEIAIIN